MQTVGGGVPGQHLLDRQFGETVRVDRSLGGVFVDHGAIGRPVDGGGRGEHELGNARFLHGGEQVLRADDVHLEVERGFADRFRDQRRGAEMQHGLGLRGFQRGDQPGAVAQIDLDEFDVARDGRGMAAPETVEHDDFVAAIAQPFRGDAADVAGAAGHKHLHDSSIHSNRTR